jgi:hypothetical protein
MTEATASRRASELARMILDDLRGAAYYADPQVLAGLIRTGDRQTPEDERNAVEVLRFFASHVCNGSLSGRG